jgi:hypothetical protein
MSEQVKEESEGMEFMPEQEYLSAQDLAATMSSAEIEKLKSGGTAKSILYMIGALFMGGMAAIGGLAFVVGIIKLVTTSNGSIDFGYIAIAFFFGTLCRYCVAKVRHFKLVVEEAEEALKISAAMPAT